MEPRITIARFDRFFVERGMAFEGIVVGGTALGLLGVVSRQTRDCDILQPDLPLAILDAARDFAALLRREGEPLDDAWSNNGPARLADVLPDGWQLRLQLAYQGQAMTLRCLGRMELLMSKLFALCDRGLDLADCVALAPTAEELHDLTPWLEQQDGNPDWPTHVRATLDDLRRRPTDGV